MTKTIKSNIPEIDLHGYTAKNARAYLIEEIEKYRQQGINTVKVIHGFNRGTKIKDWLKNSKNIYITANVKDVFDDPTNPGISYISLL